MNKAKQVSILVLAVVLLIGGLYVIARNISQKNKMKTESADQAAQQLPIGIFSHSDDSHVFADVIGSVTDITEKTLTVSHLQNSTVVNINGSTSVVVLVDGKQPAIAQIADIKVGEAVKVTYNQATKNVVMISVIRPAMETQEVKK